MQLLYILLFFSAVLNAQIGEVNHENNCAKIYNTNGSYSGNYINLSSDAVISGFNSDYIVITEGNCAKIYNSKGSYTGNYINLNSGSYVKNVTPSNILIKVGNTTKYYNFLGQYTGNYTNN
jgi:hypothetical protein